MSAQAMQPAHDYSDQQLRAAWSACRLRTWPPTFEEAMADAQYSRLVCLHAWLIAHPSKRAAAAPVDPAASGPAPLPRPRFAAPPPGFIDHKRAAAGDRDDD